MNRDAIQVACASLLLGLLVALMGLGLHAALGADVGQIPPNVPSYVRDWFKAVRSPGGVPCCDIADGHRTAWRYASDGLTFEVPLGGEWRAVPPEAVIRNQGNPVGEAVVWYRDYGDQIADPDRYFIRCFVPESEV
jgi:hypothetical protein